jgi:hypothetical protein
MFTAVGANLEAIRDGGPFHLFPYAAEVASYSNSAEPHPPLPANLLPSLTMKSTFGEYRDSAEVSRCVQRAIER